MAEEAPQDCVLYLIYDPILDNRAMAITLLHPHTHTHTLQRVSLSEQLALLQYMYNKKLLQRIRNVFLVKAPVKFPHFQRLTAAAHGWLALTSSSVSLCTGFQFMLEQILKSFVYKALNGPASNYIKELPVPYEPTGSFRSSLGLLVVPRVRQVECPSKQC